MRIMLGKEFPVLEVKTDVVALHSMNDYQSGKMYFPKSVLRKSGEKKVYLKISKLILG